jgi:hypothetical protein
MKPIFFSLCLAALGGFFTASSAKAQGFGGQGNLGFLPWGFYQPYGAQYGTSLRTPPYFATNPPVYYGARYARPYGLSPFASPPMLSAPASYAGRESTQFVRPPMGNPYVTESCVDCFGDASKNESSLASNAPVARTMGEVQINPFAVDSSRVAKR